MSPLELLEKNVMRWVRFAPDVALQFLHLPEATREPPPLENLETWFKDQNLKHVTVFHVFGNAMGAVYLAAKSWLEKDRSRQLVIFEDHVFELREFFKTSLAQELLHHPQVYLFPLLQSDAKIHEQLSYFLTLPYHVAVIPAYESAREEIATMFRTKVQTQLEYFRRTLGEHLDLGKLFFINYFQNLSLLSQASWGNRLFGKMPQVPAIICGAGPSLEKSIPYLKELQEKAIIIAGGTSMNALNAQGVYPHLGAGIDPHIDQYYRILANTAYEVPYFFRNRINPIALKAVHGEKLFISGAGGYLFPGWVEELLGISGAEIEEGHSVVGFSTALAHAMGCNPILFVGMDLAYTENKSYSSGIQNHPIHQRRQFYRTKNEQEELITAEDIYGKKVFTTSKWIMESEWFHHFASRHPDVQLFNCTEGGVGLSRIPNLSLVEFTKTLSQTSRDVEGMLFAALSEAEFPSSVSKASIQKAVNKIHDEIKNGDKDLKNIVKELEKKKNAESLIKALETKPIYRYLLKNFEISHSELYKRELVRFEIDKKNLKREREILIEHYTFFRKVCECVEKAIEIHFSQPQDEAASHTTSFVMPENLKENPQCELSIFKAKNGQILSQTGFIEGKREGPAFRFYPNGTPAAVLNYCGDLLDGEQQHFYRSGQLRSSLHYRQGALDGQQKLYYPNGSLKNESHFTHGLREGTEKRWNEQGIQTVEAHYKNNVPVDIAKEWYEDGLLKCETFYSAEDCQYSQVKRYDSQGKLLSDEEMPMGDFFEEFVRRIAIFTVNLREIQRHVFGLTKKAAEDTIRDEKGAAEIEAQLQEMWAQLKKIEALNGQIQEAVGLTGHGEEPIWKSPQVRAEIETQYKEISDELHKGLQDIGEAYHTLVTKLNRLQHE